MICRLKVDASQSLNAFECFVIMVANLGSGCAIKTSNLKPEMGPQIFANKYCHSNIPALSVFPVSGPFKPDRFPLF